MTQAASLKYMTGFGNHFESEAVPGALPIGQNTPQKCPLGLYAEQLSGSAFTAPRPTNFRTWLYRIRPSVTHLPFKPIDSGSITADFSTGEITPNQMRWKPIEIPSKEEKKVDFSQGWFTVGGTGAAEAKSGYAIHLYACNADMENKCFYSSDGELLIVPQHGTLHVFTEMGKLEVPPNFICVIPRGIKFSVNLDGPSRGYILEVFEGRFRIPDLGPIGANGLANPQDFEHPVAAYEDKDGIEYTIVNKFLGKLFAAQTDHSFLDVVGWRGNFVPYRYDLSRFCTHNTVSYDHTDPSIFTVITCQSLEAGTAVADFVIFPPRWGVAENTFRPPYYHRNVMCEFMGLIHGEYEAKKGGFVPGGSSLHTCMTGHGPDAKTFLAASEQELVPQRVADGTMAFMFESKYTLRLTKWAMESMEADDEYYKCWQDLPKLFSS